MKSSPKDDDNDVMGKVLMKPQASRSDWRHLLKAIKCRASIGVKGLVFIRYNLVPQVVGNIFRTLAFFFISVLGGMVLQSALQPYGGSYLSYMVVGMAAHYAINFGLICPPGTISHLYWTGQVETLLASPTPFLAFFVGDILWIWLAWGIVPISCWLIGGVFLGATFAPAPNIVLTVLLLISGIVATFGLGLLAVSTFFFLEAKVGSPPVQYVIQDILLYLVTGLSYPVTALPPWLQLVGMALPETYVFDGVRRALLNPGSSSPTLPIHVFFPLHPIIVDIVLTLLFIPVTLLIGWLALKLSVEYAKRKGTLTRWV